MTAAPYTDEKYYQAVAPRSLAERFLVMARDRIYAEFLRRCRPAPEDAILDVGVSDVVNDAANVLERKYLYPERITAAGLGTAEDFQKAFPAVTYVRIAANGRLPFPDQEFRIATSNAVLEHVGSRNNQAAFVAELLRVARRVFITVPHRYFPVEHHTAIPFLHFTDATFGRACRRFGKSEWADESNLILMSRGRLRALVPPHVDAVTGYTGIPLGCFSSNLFLFFPGPRP